MSYSVFSAWHHALFVPEGKRLLSSPWKMMVINNVHNYFLSVREYTHLLGMQWDLFLHRSCTQLQDRWLLSPRIKREREGKEIHVSFWNIRHWNIFCVPYPQNALRMYGKRQGRVKARIHCFERSQRSIYIHIGIQAMRKT